MTSSPSSSRRPPVCTVETLGCPSPLCVCCSQYGSCKLGLGSSNLAGTAGVSLAGDGHAGSGLEQRVQTDSCSPLVQAALPGVMRGVSALPRWWSAWTRTASAEGKACISLTLCTSALLMLNEPRLAFLHFLDACVTRVQLHPWGGVFPFFSTAPSHHSPPLLGLAPSENSLFSSCHAP